MEFRNKQPIFLQIADNICERILLKDLKEKERIPSVRELAETLAVNPNTVVRSFSILQELGIIENKRGLGYFISENGYQKTIEHKKENFIENELKYTFKTMRLLSLSIREIEKLYSNYLHIEEGK